MEKILILSVLVIVLIILIGLMFLVHKLNKGIKKLIITPKEAKILSNRLYRPDIFILKSSDPENIKKFIYQKYPDVKEIYIDQNGYIITSCNKLFYFDPFHCVLKLISDGTK